MQKKPGRPAGTLKTEVHTAVDAHVGSQLRLRRTLMGMSQTKLGEAVGITFQQLQKYERGANRVSASRLLQFSQVLDVPIAFFFDGMQQGGIGVVAEDLGTREMLELARGFAAIKSTKLRKAILELTKAVGSAQD